MSMWSGYRPNRPEIVNPAGYLRGIRAVLYELTEAELLPPDNPEPDMVTEPESRALLACALLMSVQPSDRALAGWGIDPEQSEALRALAERPIRGAP